MGVAQHGTRRVRSSRNILLRRLSTADQDLLEPHVSEEQVTRGRLLADPATSIEAAWFPSSATVSLMENVGRERFAEVAMIGREGLIGWPALLGCDRSAHTAICESHGVVLKIPIDALRSACARSASLKPALLQFVHMLIVQMSRAIASHVQDSLDQRLARWLLMHHDRVGGDMLAIRHDEIADRLNVRRASITDGLHVLEGERLIRCDRGRILIRDRAALEAFAGDSYGRFESDYRAIIAPFGKSSHSAERAVVN